MAVNLSFRLSDFAHFFMLFSYLIARFTVFIMLDSCRNIIFIFVEYFFCVDSSIAICVHMINKIEVYDTVTVCFYLKHPWFK